jgi:hypothetical protein
MVRYKPSILDKPGPLQESYDPLRVARLPAASADTQAFALAERIFAF